MATGYEVEMYQNIGVIARSLRTIANCMEAAEKRAREKEDVMHLEGHCLFTDCGEPVVMMLNGERFCQNHVDDGFARMRPAMAAVRRGMAELEFQQSEAAYDAALDSTDHVLGVGAYAEQHKDNPDPGVHRAIARWKERTT